MKIAEIRQKARQLGVKNYSRMNKTDLIKAIQVTEGNSPCYQQIKDCRVYDCCWREDCQV
uniref:Rho termination factor-like N-terminal domain-containing protein n=1 Tax=Desulfobacca acetoxidans TaxID=60893 RepID=A0A7C3UYT6_9BACT